MPMNEQEINFQRVKGSGLFQYMRPAEAAQYTRLSESTLAKLRMRDTQESGPRFSKHGGCVIYRREDLDAWIDGNLAGGENLQ